MLRCLPFFFALISAAAAAAAANSPSTPRNPAYAQIRGDALVARLLDQAAEDIKSRRYEKALEKAAEAERLRPNDAVALNTKAAALVELHRFDEAATTLQAAMAADPSAFAPQFNLGEMLSLQKKYPDAAAQFSLLQARFGPLPLLKYNLYLNQALAGQQARANETLRLMRYPADGVAWYFAFAADRLLAGRRAEGMDLLAAAAAIHRDEMSTYQDTLRKSGLLK